MNDTNPKTRGWGLWEVALIAGLALGLRLLHIEEVRHVDSYFHIMAAASWLRDGTLSIGGEVPYDRAYLFTYLVAAFQSLFGGTTFVSGLPAILAGVAWVAALFIWVRSVAGRTAAWVAGLFFCFDIGSLALAHMVRFYTLHGLAFFIGAIGLYYLVTRRPSLGTVAATGMVVIAAFWLSYHLQYTTVIGLIALAFWLVVEISPTVLRYLRERRVLTLALLVPVLVAVVVGGLLFLQSDIAARYWRLFQGVPMWAESRGEDLTYYILKMEGAYGFLWALSPLAAVIAIARYGRPAIFSVVLFAVPFVLHSLAAFQAERFLSYAMPFFFAIWGLAAAALLPQLKSVARQAVYTVARIRLPGRIHSFATWGFLVILFAALASTGRSVWWDAYKFVVHNERPSRMTHPRWDQAAIQIKPLIESVDVVVISGGAASYYYMDRVHVIAHTYYAAGAPEFSRFALMGVPAISQPESLETLVRCNNSGLVAIDSRWGTDWGFSEKMVEVLQANAEPLELPEDWGIHAYLWAHDAEVAKEIGCPILEARRAPRLR
ncbi:MAG: hypothetical protein R6U98_04255 [Pirellulaceae bacterium]